MRLIPPCLIVLLLFVSCDGKKERVSSSDTSERTGPGSTKSQRTRPEDPPPAGRDLRPDFEKAKGIADSAERDQALSRVAWDAMELDPPLAREAFGLLPAESPERIRLIQHYAMRIAATDLTEALKWADSFGSEKENTAARCRIALVLSETDPQKAAELLSESAMADRESDVAIVQVLQRWAGNDPPAAAAWVADFPEGEAREAGIKAVVSPWLENDAAAAFDWIAALEGDLRKEAVAAISDLIDEETEDAGKKILDAAPAHVREWIELQRKEAGQDDPPP
jgi:TPR repeat protein